jgi:hypothetical protein
LPNQACPWGFFIRNFVEIIGFIANLVGIAKRDAEHALAARLERDHVFPRGEYDATEANHAFLLDRLADHPVFRLIL